MPQTSAQNPKRVYGDSECLDDSSNPNTDCAKRQRLSNVSLKPASSEAATSKGDNPPAQSTEPYYKVHLETTAMYLTRCVNPLMEFTRVVAKAFAVPTSSETAQGGSDEELLMLMQIHPRLNMFMSSFIEHLILPFPDSKGGIDFKNAGDVLKKISDKNTDFRARDIYQLNTNVHNYLNLAGSKHYSISPAFSLDFRSKWKRGFQRPITGRLLCPIQFIQEYDNNPTEFYRRAKEGEFKCLKANYFSSFLYDEKDFFEKGRGEDFLSGFLKGHVFMQASHYVRALSHRPPKAFRGVWLGAWQASSNNRKRSKNSNIQAPNITKVTPEMLAYVAMCTRFALSETRNWRPVDGEFDHRAFFEAIVVALYLNPDDGLVEQDPTRKIFDYWDSEVAKALSSASKEPDLVAKRPTSALGPIPPRPVQAVAPPTPNNQLPSTASAQATQLHRPAAQRSTHIAEPPPQTTTPVIQTSQDQSPTRTQRKELFL